MLPMTKKPAAWGLASPSVPIIVPAIAAIPADDTMSWQARVHSRLRTNFSLLVFVDGNWSKGNFCLAGVGADCDEEPSTLNSVGSGWGDSDGKASSHFVKPMGCVPAKFATVVVGSKRLLDSVDCIWFHFLKGFSIKTVCMTEHILGVAPNAKRPELGVLTLQKAWGERDLSKSRKIVQEPKRSRGDLPLYKRARPRRKPGTSITRFPHRY